MPDVYASIESADEAVQERLAEVLELRAADAAQQAMLEDYLAELPLPDGARVLVMPGRLSIQKHQIGLMLALLRLAKSGRLPEDVVLLMPGRRSHALVDRVVRRLAGRPELRGAVRLIGTEDNMRELYWASDLLVLFSLWEGLPNVALEACASSPPETQSRHPASASAAPPVTAL